MAPISDYLLLGKEQHSAADLPPFKRCVGLRGVCQRIGAIDSDGQFSQSNPGFKLLEVVRVLLDVRKAVRACKKQRAFFLESHQIEGRHVPAGLSIDHQVACGSETVKVRLKRILADAVKHNADSPALRHASRFLGDVGLFRNDDLISASFPHKFCLSLGRRNSDDSSPANLRHLTQQQAYSSGRCLDQAPVSRLDRVDKMREDISQKSLVHSRRRLFEIDALWYGDEPNGWDNGMRGVRISPEADAVPYSDIVDLSTDCFHDSDSLTSQNRGKLRFTAARAVIESLPDEIPTAFLNIEKVDAGRVDTHKGLRGTGNGHRQLFQLHYIRTAVGVNA